MPLYEKISQWKDRKKAVQLPVFLGYLFVRAPIRQRRLDIIKVESVVRIVRIQ